MIEREIVKQRIKEFQIKEHVASSLRRSGYSDTKLQRTPLGEKVIVYASRPGLVVGRQGSNIRKLTEDLKNEFELENPQIEVGEVESIYLDANIVAEMIALSLERFGTNKFKGVMHKTLENVKNAGALGVEIIISGKLPSARARSWRIYGGYLKKCGDISVSGMRKAQTTAQLKSGIVGIKVNIMPPDLFLPDRIKVLDNSQIVFEETTEEESVEGKKSKKGKKGAKDIKEKKSDTKANGKSKAKPKPKGTNKKSKKQKVEEQLDDTAREEDMEENIEASSPKDDEVMKEIKKDAKQKKSKAANIADDETAELTRSESEDDKQLSDLFSESDTPDNIVEEDNQDE